MNRRKAKVSFLMTTDWEDGIVVKHGLSWKFFKTLDICTSSSVRNGTKELKSFQTPNFWTKTSLFQQVVMSKIKWAMPKPFGKMCWCMFA